MSQPRSAVPLDGFTVSLVTFDDVLVDEIMMAPVLCQPSLRVGISRKAKAALHISAEDLATVKRRTAAGVRLLALRFTGDAICPKERFERLREELGRGVETVEIDSSRGNAHGISGRAHSVVTTDLIDREGHPTRIALDRVLSFLAENLCLERPRAVGILAPGRRA